MTQPGVAQHQIELRAFLQQLVGPNVPVVEAQDNRVPEPREKTFITIQPILHTLLGTNIIAYVDNVFVGDIAGTTLTVSDVVSGSLTPGLPIFAVDALPGTTIESQLSGAPGGTGTYLISPVQDLPSRKMSGGKIRFTAPVEAKFQVSVYSNNMRAAGDLVDRIVMMFSTEAAIDAMPNAVPLYSTPPKQLPFLNAAKQAEWRWITELSVQANQTIDWTQQFMDEVKITYMPFDQETT